MKLKKLLVIGTLVLGIGANTANAYIENYGEPGYAEKHPKLGGITLNENYDEQCEIFKQKLDAHYIGKSSYYKFTKNSKECGYANDYLVPDENNNVKKISMTYKILGFEFLSDPVVVAKAYVNSVASVFKDLEVRTSFSRSNGRMEENRTVHGINSENQSINFLFSLVQFEQLPKGKF